MPRKRPVVLSLTTALLVAISAVLMPSALATGDDVSVRDLTVEHVSEPLNVAAPKPRLGWTLETGRHGGEQSAYEIQVVSAEGADVWNSGKVGSSRTYDVEYAGDSLESMAAYTWRVRVWDEEDEATPWSEPSAFETAFLEQADFVGDWIATPTPSRDLPLDGAAWIWSDSDAASSAPIEDVYFRKTFTLDESPGAATFSMTADDRFVLFVNGTEVTSSEDRTDAWRTAKTVDVAQHLEVGENTVAVKATNALPGPAGLLGVLEVETSSDAVLVRTDDSWLASGDGGEGWTLPEFDDEDWAPAAVAADYGQGPWGSSVTAPEPPDSLLRREFEADDGIQRARVHVSGLGYSKLFLNGQKVGDHQLDPGFTVYDKTTLYVTHDVTDALRGGDNAIAVQLGRGWFGEQRFDDWEQSAWFDNPKLKLVLDIEYADGRSERIVSDEEWKAAEGPTVAQSVFYGESYDARLEQPGWNDSSFDDAQWRDAVVVDGPGGELTPQMFAPIRETEALDVVETTHPAADVIVHDVGEPTAGWASVGLRGPRGATVKITYGEKLDEDGRVINDSPPFLSDIQAYSYTLKGGDEEWFQPSYSYAGYQYVQVTVPDGVELVGVEPARVHTDVERTGEFSSSSELYNRYHAAQGASTLNNLHSIPTDTPMYEKRAYTADAFLTADSAIASFDMQPFYENWMRTHRDDQSEQGTLPITVPGPEPSKDHPTSGDPVWSSSYVRIVWDLYWYYGNTQVLEEHYEGLQRWMEFFAEHVSQNGDVFRGTTFGDWLTPSGSSESHLTGTAYVYRGATTMADIARVLGHEGDVAAYTELAERIRGGFNESFYDADEGAYGEDADGSYQQTANLLPLSFGLVPEDERPRVLENLVSNVEERGNRLNTGAIGTKEILPVLTEAGRQDLAHAIATNPEEPGWGYWFLELGATTMWEEWNANSRSRNHAFMGVVDDWLYQHVAGLQPTSPGYASLRVQPFPGDDLDHAEASVRTPRGTAASSWSREGGCLRLDVTVPAGSEAEVLVPADEGHEVGAPAAADETSEEEGYAGFEVGSGQHRFVAGDAGACGSDGDGDGSGDGDGDGGGGDNGNDDNSGSAPGNTAGEVEEHRAGGADQERATDGNLLPRTGSGWTVAALVIALLLVLAGLTLMARRRFYRA